DRYEPPPKPKPPPKTREHYLNQSISVESRALIQEVHYWIVKDLLQDAMDDLHRFSIQPSLRDIIDRFQSDLLEEKKLNPPIPMISSSVIIPSRSSHPSTSLDTSSPVLSSSSGTKTSPSGIKSTSKSISKSSHHHHHH